MSPDRIDIAVRQYWEGTIELDELESLLLSAPQTMLVEHFTDILNRVESAMNFALTPTFGYEEVTDPGESQLGSIGGGE